MGINCCEGIVLLMTEAELSQHMCLTHLDVVAVWVTQKDLLNNTSSVGGAN
jgi:hypothetical protein